MGKWGIGVIKITAWGVETEWKDASMYYTCGRSAKNPMEFHSVAKVALASSLAFCFTFSTPITHFLSSHTSRSFIGTKQDTLKSFQKSTQTWDCKARAQELMWPREETVAGTVLRVSGFKLPPGTVIPMNEDAKKEGEEFSLESLVHACHFLNP